MRHWAIFTVLLYLIILVVLTAPMLIVYGIESSPEEGWEMTMSLDGILAIYQHWFYFIWLGVLGLGQSLLLLVPVRITERKLIPRRRLLVPIITAAFLFANIVFATSFALACAIFREHAFDIFEVFGTEGLRAMLAIIVIALALWSVWALLFYRFTRSDAPDTLVKRLTGWLLRGSILELLVAVPSHIIVRHRNDCCAPAGTFWGIVTGLSIMILSFGPGVFFLFAARMERLRLGRRSESVSGVQAAADTHERRE